MPKVSPEIITWARETAGLSLEDAARAIGLTGQHASERLAEMERGEREPTRRQLGEMAKKYRRPLLTFYLPARPKPGRPTHDFRTLHEREAGGEAVLDAILRDVKARQAIVVGALEDSDHLEPLPFVGAVNLRDGPGNLAKRMEEILSFTRVEFRAARNVTEAFRALRDACEAAGVYVILMGNLGSFHSALSPKVFRGFAMADEFAPFIVINENDARSAWAFTLLHELAHILLGASGISGYGSEEELEHTCDAAAAQFLLAANELGGLAEHAGNIAELKEAIGEFANPRKVSRTMLAYNLWRVGVIPWASFQDLAAVFTAEREEAEENRVRSQVDYYVVRRHRIGRALIQLVNRMVADGVLSSTSAGRVLGVKPTAVGRMTEGAA
ncbi:MAG TPA: XRE family transcriptional regulator [Sphingomicrobium sp.]|nr:XRE family transcriptional regulator [Sphingomicrobium sp.]